MAGKHTWLAVLEPGHSPDLLKDGVSIFDLSGEEADDVAEFIVRACNSHDELLEALERAEARFAHIRDRLNSGRLDTATRRASFANDVWHMECEARAAIAKAKGEDGEASNG